MPLMLDTSAYSAFKRGHAEIEDAMRRASRLLVPTTALGELLGGFERGTRRRANREDLRAFLRTPRVSVTPTIEPTAQRYAVIYAAVRVTGRPIPTNDMWIAASAMEHGAELLTLDRDFLAVAQIVVRCCEP